MPTLNPFEIAQHQLDEAAEILGLSPAMHALLRAPKRELQFTAPCNDGRRQLPGLSGFPRAVQRRTRGPAKGGIRYHPNVTVDEVRRWPRG